jgi:cation diffusion facilitator CzcD-associated flavoprotein CzcO
MEYSYSFDEDLQQTWQWTEVMAAQPEILRYANHVADRFDLRRDMVFDTRVTSAVYAEDLGAWEVTTDAGGVIRAQFCVMATGCLSVPNTPSILGAADFAGLVLHTGHWPAEGVDLAGLRVGVIGTGSSGTQLIPVLAEQVASLTVLQRTPNYTMPAHNVPLTPEFAKAAKADYACIRAEQRQSPTGIIGYGFGFGGRDETPPSGNIVDSTAEQRAALLDELGFAAVRRFEDVSLDMRANEMACDMYAPTRLCHDHGCATTTSLLARPPLAAPPPRHPPAHQSTTSAPPPPAFPACVIPPRPTNIHQPTNRWRHRYREQLRRVVKDPATAAGLSPRAYPLGCKRPVMDTRYFETFNRANVRLVDLRDGPIERITATGVQTKGEGLVELDALVYATGFDAMTGGLLKMDIRGRGGARLADAWRDGPKTFLGLQVHGFPNLFTITGPGSPSVISNMMVSIEQHVDYVADMLAHMRRRDARRVEADAAAQEAWVKKVNDVADGTMYTAVGGTGAACAVYIVSTSSVVSCCVLVGGVCITCVILSSPAHRSPLLFVVRRAAVVQLVVSRGEHRGEDQSLHALRGRGAWSDVCAK